MKLYYVMHWDNEDPSWSDIEYASLDKTKCVDWIKNNWDSFYSGDWDEDDEDLPCFIEDFDEEEIAYELAIKIKETDLEMDFDKDSINYHEGYDAGYKKCMEENKPEDKPLSKIKGIIDENQMTKKEREKYDLTKNCLGAIKLLIEKAGL
jgi:hypothetical protein